VPWQATVAGFVVAAVISVSLFVFGSRLLALHEAFRQRILVFAGIPLVGSGDFRAFPGIGAQVALTPVPSYHGERWKPLAICTVVAVLLLIPFLRSRLTHSLIVFAWMLLALSAATIVFEPASRGDMEFFVSFWLRTEFVLWILIPFLVSSVTGLTEPSWVVRTLSTVGAPLYAILWSAMRLAFCAGILFLTGPVLMLFLWSVFGLTFDLLSLCTFYSLIVWRGARGLPPADDLPSSVSGR
jgi:hypothetical protein